MAYYGNPYMYNPYIPQQPVPPQQEQQGITWVQGESGAKAYMVAPKTTAVLWDSENQTIYIKSSDSAGIPTMRILDWTERETAPKSIPLQVEYVTKTEFDELKQSVEHLINRKDNNNGKPSVQRNEQQRNEQQHD